MSRVVGRRRTPSPSSPSSPSGRSSAAMSSEAHLEDRHGSCPPSCGLAASRRGVAELLDLRRRCARRRRRRHGAKSSSDGPSSPAAPGEEEERHDQRRATRRSCRHRSRERDRPSSWCRSSPSSCSFAAVSCSSPPSAAFLISSSAGMSSSECRPGRTDELAGLVAVVAAGRVELAHLVADLLGDALDASSANVGDRARRPAALEARPASSRRPRRPSRRRCANSDIDGPSSPPHAANANAANTASRAIQFLRLIIAAYPSLNCVTPARRRCASRAARRAWSAAISSARMTVGRVSRGSITSSIIAFAAAR